MAADELQLTPDAIRVFVDDASAALTFYRDRLGLALRAGSPEHGYLVFDAGSLSIVVEAANPADGEGRELVGRFVGLSFSVRDIQYVHRELESRGVVFSAAPERQPWGGTLAHFYDSARNILSLVQHPAA